MYPLFQQRKKHRVTKEDVILSDTERIIASYASEPSLDGDVTMQDIDYMDITLQTRQAFVKEYHHKRAGDDNIRVVFNIHTLHRIEPTLTCSTLKDKIGHVRRFFSWIPTRPNPDMKLFRTIIKCPKICDVVLDNVTRLETFLVGHECPLNPEKLSKTLFLSGPFQPLMKIKVAKLLWEYLGHPPPGIAETANIALLMMVTKQTVVQFRSMRRRDMNAAMDGAFRLGDDQATRAALEIWLRDDPWTSSYLPLIHMNGTIKLSAWNRVEQDVIRMTKEIMRSTFPAAATYGSVHLNAQQTCAVQHALDNGLTVVTGAGGTGKTEIASELSTMMMGTERGVFIAPTGKAVETLKTRMDGKIGDVMTFHRWILKGESSRRHHLFRILDEGHMFSHLFLDEGGMVSVWSMWHILNFAERCGVTHLVIFGDTHQLPPVNNDGTLLDALRPMAIHLVENFRSTPGLLGLLDHLRNVADDTEPFVRAEAFDNKESSLVVVDSDASVYRAIEQAVSHPAVTKENTRIIVNRKKGLLEVPDSDPVAKHLLRIYDLFNPKKNRTKLSEYHPGDIVICTVNISQGGDLIVANGSEGLVLSNEKKGGGLVIEFDNGFVTRVYPRDDNAEIVEKVRGSVRKGSILTVNKFQGSEKDRIIVVFTGNYRPNHTIQMLYTAASRARKHLTLIIPRQTLRMYTTPNVGRVLRNDRFNALVRRQCIEEECTVPTMD